jgi:hypothetical protein
MRVCLRQQHYVAPPRQPTGITFIFNKLTLNLASILWPFRENFAALYADESAAQVETVLLR